jgi:hypothetical protein
VLEHFELHLEGADDKMDCTIRLRELSNRFLVQQSKALIAHKVKAEKLGIQAEDKRITAVVVRKAIEEDFADNEDFMQRWPPKLEGRRGGKKDLQQWLAGWTEPCTSYAWPSPPEGGKYFMKAVV